MDKKYCKNCVRLYSNDTDQCEIPACGLIEEEEKSFMKALGKSKCVKIDFEGQHFITSYLDHIHKSSYKKIYGHPSQLNKNNDCYFHKSLPRIFSFLTGFIRAFY